MWSLLAVQTEERISQSGKRLGLFFAGQPLVCILSPVSSMVHSRQKRIFIQYVAEVIVTSLELPSHINLDQVTMRPVAQAAQHKLVRGKLEPK